MDLRSDYPFWLLDQGIIRSYPSLPHDIHTDVVVMGAGISGALAAWHLSRSGMDVIVVDQAACRHGEYCRQHGIAAI